MGVADTPCTWKYQEDDEGLLRHANSKSEEGRNVPVVEYSRDFELYSQQVGYWKSRKSFPNHGFGKVSCEMLRRAFNSTGMSEARRHRKLEAKNMRLKKRSPRSRSRTAPSMTRREG